MHETARDAVRFRHIAKRPQVSATHVPGEEFAVTVHGRARRVDHRAPEERSCGATLLDVYVPRYGAKWEEFLDGGPAYARIEADKMFTFPMEAAQ